MKTDFMPGKYSELHTFQANYKTKLLVHSTDLGLDQDEVDEAINIIDKNRDLYDAMISKMTGAKAAAEEYRLHRIVAIEELRRISKMIKSSKKYSASVGEDFNILPPKIVNSSLFDKKPALKLKINGHIVDISFKKGESTGINIYSRRGAEKEFTFFSVNTEIHFMDKRDKLDPLSPELREYYAFFIEKNREVGLQSDVVKVIVP